LGAPKRGGKVGYNFRGVMYAWEYNTMYVRSRFRGDSHMGSKRK